MNTQEIGRKIKEQRVYKKLTQEELAEIVDISTTYMSCIERGIKIPSFKVMIDIAKALDMSFDFILSNEVDVLKDNKINFELHEFEMMLEMLNNKSLINHFVKLSWAIANSLKNDEKDNRNYIKSNSSLA